MCPKDNCFPGLYCIDLLRDPWLTDGQTMILSSVWGSREVILSVNVVRWLQTSVSPLIDWHMLWLWLFSCKLYFCSCEILRVTPQDSDYSWNVLALDKNNIVAGNPITCIWLLNNYIVLSLCAITFHVCLPFPVSSSLITLPQINYGINVSQTESHWEWQEVSTPFPKPSDEVLLKKCTEH